MAEPEQEWLEAYRQGDTDALGELVEHYKRPLFSFILKMTEGRDDADEIFQEVWFRAIRNLDKFREGRFLSWLFRIAHNLVIDRARKMKPDFSLQDKRDGENDYEDRVASDEPDPSRLSIGRDLSDRIMEAVKKLPDLQKAVFLMRTEGNIPFKEIARIQEVSINTVLARMQYAISKLRTELVELRKS